MNRFTRMCNHATTPNWVSRQCNRKKILNHNTKYKYYNTINTKSACMELMTFSVLSPKCSCLPAKQPGKNFTPTATHRGVANTGINYTTCCVLPKEVRARPVEPREARSKVLRRATKAAAPRAPFKLFSRNTTVSTVHSSCVHLTEPSTQN